MMSGPRRWLPLICLFSLVTADDAVANYRHDYGHDYRSSGVYGEGGEVVKQRLGDRQKKELQREILNLLSLHHRPKPWSWGTTSNSSAPKYMLDLYERLVEQDEARDIEVSLPLRVEALPEPGDRAAEKDSTITSSADIIMSFTNHHGHKSGVSHVRHEHKRLFRFSLVEVPLTSVLLAAELRVYKMASNLVELLRPGDGLVVRAYQVVRDRPPIFQDTVTVSPHTEGWLIFNVSRAVSSYDALMMGEVLLYVDVTCNRTGKVFKASEVSIVNKASDVDKQAFMVGFYHTGDTNTLIRRRRSTRRRNRSGRKYFAHGTSVESFRDRRKRRSCQKRYMHVNFRDLGWQDWIIAPDGYSAFYCYGECSFPLNAHMNATNHAIVQTLVHLMDPHLAPKSCCAPKKLSAISVLYFDDNSNVILKKYRNMVVKSCGCH